MTPTVIAHPAFRPVTRLAPSGGWPFRAAEAPACDGSESEVLLRRESVRWHEEQQALAAEIARLAALPGAGAVPPVVQASPVPRAHWFARLETAVHRMLPGGAGSLLGLFLCVSMSIVLISALLPLVDRV